LDRRPFGEKSEGLSPFWDKSCVFEPKVQTDDFEYLSFDGVIRFKPFRRKALRKFKRFHREFRHFMPSFVGRFDLQP